MATLILTIVGDDQPGLVSALSAPIHAHGGSWDRSQMARLAGKFAGVVLVTVGDAVVADLVAELEALDLGLHLSVERTDEPAPLDEATMRLDLLGADHPGIVAEISSCLAAERVSIEELATSVNDAPMAGGNVFEAHAILRAPRTLSTDTLRSLLEALANELMVDITLDDD
jgi:glycine cleavage system regulatory protein